MYCESWRIQGGDEYDWITFNNSTNINHLYFDYAPPKDIEDMDIEIEVTLVDSSPYRAELLVEFTV